MPRPSCSRRRMWAESAAAVMGFFLWRDVKSIERSKPARKLRREKADWHAAGRAGAWRLAALTGKKEDASANRGFAGASTHLGKSWVQSIIGARAKRQK